MDLINLTLILVTIAVIAGAMGFESTGNLRARIGRWVFGIFITLALVSGMLVILGVGILF